MPKIPAAPDIIQLRYSELEELVASLLDAHADRKSPLSARFRLFRQRGFPPNVITLAKTRFAYDLEAVLRVTLAFWMMHGFVPQETIPIVIERDWAELRAGFQHAYALMAKEGVETSAVNQDRKVLLISPKNLHAFSLAKDEEASPADTVGLEVASARTARDRLFGEGHRESFAPVTVIDLHRLAAWVRDAILDFRWASSEPFIAFARD